MKAGDLCSGRMGNRDCIRGKKKGNGDLKETQMEAIAKRTKKGKEESPLPSSTGKRKAVEEGVTCWRGPRRGKKSQGRKAIGRGRWTSTAVTKDGL